jgi:hypothetical protein
MQNLAELTRRLIAAKAEFILVGGFAAIAHGVVRATLDVDICCRFSEDNLMRIQHAVADPHPVQCASLKNLYWKMDLGILDCLSEIKAVGNFDEVAKHSVELELPIGKCQVIDLDTLIIAKEAMGCDHDRVTVRELKEIKKRLQQS